MPNLIPNVTEIFYSSNGTLLEIRGNALYHAQSNYANLLLVYIEDGNGADTTTLVNFSPLKFQSTTKPVFTSHWFFMNYLGETQDTIVGETANRSFSKFSINVPNSVLRYNNFSMNKDTVTVIQRYGSNFLGTFQTVSALINAYPQTESGYAGTVNNLVSLSNVSNPAIGSIYKVTNNSFVNFLTFNSISEMLSHTGKVILQKLFIAPLNQYYDYITGPENLISSYRAIPSPSKYAATAYKYLGGNGPANFNNWQNVLTPSNLADDLFTAYVIDTNSFYQMTLSNSTFSWTSTQTINAVLQTKQYNTFEISVNAGLSNIDDLTPIETTATQMIMQSVANIEQQYFTTNSLLSSHIDDTANPHRTSIYNLIDTDVSEVEQNGIILRYNSTTQKYEDSTSLTTAESNIGALQTRMGLAESNIGGLQSVQANIINGLQDITYDNEISGLTATTIKGAIDENNALIDSAQDDVDTHVARTDNPHQVTKTQLGLSDVDNTSDLDKPISTATQNALDNKVDLNPTVVSSLSSTDFIYGQQGGVEKRITVTDLKTSIIENLVAFGYVKFSTKDGNGQPDIANPQTNKIYLFNPTDSDLPNDQFEEWIYIDADDIFEKIGTTAIALEDYYDIDEVDGLLSDYDLTTVVDEKIQVAKQIQYYPNTKNDSGSTIFKGDVVQFAGSQGDFIKIKRAVGSEIIANPEALMGLAESDILDGQFGNVVWFGQVKEFNTGSLTLGQVLYFDTSSGSLTATEPATNKIIVAAVEKVSSGGGSNGILLVRIKWVSRDIDEVDGLTDALAGKVAKTGDNITGNLNVSGNVGIGTTSPATKLSIITSTNDDGIQIRRNSSSAGDYATLGFRISDGDGVVNFGEIQSVRQTDGADLLFLTRIGTSTTEKVRIKNSGNVGINETSPTAQLQVKSSATNKVPLIVDSPASPTVSLQEWKVNGSTVSRIDTTGSLLTPYVYNRDNINNGYIQLPTTGVLIARNIADANDALTINLQNASSTGLILDAQAGGTTVASIAKNGTVTAPSVVATSTVKIGAWTLSQNGTSGSLDFVVV
jgi:hypothetical protein